MQAPKPYFKKPHRAWYANIGPNGRPVWLASEGDGEKAAWRKYHALMAERQPINSDGRVLDLLERFLDHHHKNSAPASVG